jgi:hypothetical protein
MPVILTSIAPEGYDVKGQGLKKSIFAPFFYQFLQAGGDPEALKVTKKGKSYFLSDGTKVNATQTVKQGKQRFLVSGPQAQEILRGTFEKFGQQQIASKERMFQDLFGPQGPQFLKDLITKRPDQIRAAFGPAVSDTLRSALGAAAPGGTLTTEAVQRGIAAPVALEAEKFFQSAQDAANAAQLGIVGIPGFGAGFSFDPTNFGGAQSLSELQGLGLQTAGLGLQANLASAQSKFQAEMFKAGLVAGAGESAFGFAGA